MEDRNIAHIGVDYKAYETITEMRTRALFHLDIRTKIREKQCAPSYAYLTLPEWIKNGNDYALRLNFVDVIVTVEGWNLQALYPLILGHRVMYICEFPYDLEQAKLVKDGKTVIGKINIEKIEG